jgi:LacI family transcriptional regulator
MATIYDVAKRAGVAISTVSKVLSGRHAASEKTRQRVLKAVDELGYVPSAAARTLAGEPTHLLGVCITGDVPHVLALLHGIDAAVQRVDGAMLLAVARTVAEQAAAINRLVHGFQADALLVVGRHPDALPDLDVRYGVIVPEALTDAQAAFEAGRVAARDVWRG